MAIGKTTIVAFSFFLLLCPYVVKSMAAEGELESLRKEKTQ